MCRLWYLSCVGKPAFLQHCWAARLVELEYSGSEDVSCGWAESTWRGPSLEPWNTEAAYCKHPDSVWSCCLLGYLNPFVFLSSHLVIVALGQLYVSVCQGTYIHTQHLFMNCPYDTNDVLRTACQSTQWTLSTGKGCRWALVEEEKAKVNKKILDSKELVALRSLISRNFTAFTSGK